MILTLAHRTQVLAFAEELRLENATDCGHSAHTKAAEITGDPDRYDRACALLLALRRKEGPDVTPTERQALCAAIERILGL